MDPWIRIYTFGSAFCTKVTDGYRREAIYRRWSHIALCNLALEYTPKKNCSHSPWRYLSYARRVPDRSRIDVTCNRPHYWDLFQQCGFFIHLLRSSLSVSIATEASALPFISRITFPSKNCRALSFPFLKSLTAV